ncbi:MAG TPA: hypothetical protein VIK20_06975, partial [Bacteroidales bacterium]
MGFNEILSKFFGNKSQRDMKEISPYVDRIKEAYPAINVLNNDELRNKTSEIRARIQDSVTDERNRIAELKE